MIYWYPQVRTCGQIQRLAKKKTSPLIVLLWRRASQLIISRTQSYQNFLQLLKGISCLLDHWEGRSHTCHCPGMLSRSSSLGTHHSCCHRGPCCGPCCGCGSDSALGFCSGFYSCPGASQTSPCTGHSCRSTCHSPSISHHPAFSLWI